MSLRLVNLKTKIIQCHSKGFKSFHTSFSSPSSKFHISLLPATKLRYNIENFSIPSTAFRIKNDAFLPGMFPRLFTTFSQTFNSKSNTFYATTPIYYVNAAPHLGHLYSSIIVDTLVRFNRHLKGRDSLMATGTDEHGLKVHQAALAAGETPLAFCDRVSDKFRHLAKAANVSAENMAFIRTSSAQHASAVKSLWEKLVSNGLIYRDQYEGWYATSDEAFYSPEEVSEITNSSGISEHIASATGSKVLWTSEPTYRFRLSKFSAPLLEWLEKNPDAIQPETRKNEVIRYLEDGLEDLSVSRPISRVPWGLPVPGDDSQVIYVWVDALCNYLTAAGYPETQTLSQFYPADVHVVGKDILRFHAVYWPAILMGAGLPLPHQILAHGHWTSEGAKMSKSKGNGVEPLGLLEKYGIDTVRYYLLRDGGNTSDDHDFSELELQVKYKKELMGTIGNLASRLTSKALNPSLTAPTYLPDKLHSSSLKTYQSMKEQNIQFVKYLETYQFGKALDEIMNTLFQVNQFLQEQEPWKHAPRGDGEDKALCAEVLGLSLDSLRIAGILLQPIIPTKASALLSQLNIDVDERSLPFAYPCLGWKHSKQKYHPDSGFPLLSPPISGGLFPKLCS
ncbi:methionyl-tRNA synthetase [Entomophthora muscae]|uniref:Methionyl-tRNA synthetase n=1 Tax=Entomophthora muscae TaxID=34485 RepID=A0ACC2S785_9FUNG|nr:methionyl-tRNA synthetase [Entomophthora muscae]